jgi:oxygen-independent coproporphyrinogen-3 oxidase
MGLRLAEGIDARHFETRTGVALAEALDADTLAAAIEEGYVTFDGRHLAATPSGLIRLDALLPRLVR